MSKQWDYLAKQPHTKTLTPALYNKPTQLNPKSLTASLQRQSSPTGTETLCPTLSISFSSASPYLLFLTIHAFFFFFLNFYSQKNKAHIEGLRVLFYQSPLSSKFVRDHESSSNCVLLM